MAINTSISGVKYPNYYKCPQCGADACDLKCSVCNGEEGNDCEECFGIGFIDDYFECLECGEIYHESEAGFE